MRSRPEISEEEIQQRMNFEGLLHERHQYLKKQNALRLGRNLAISAGVITLLAVIYFAISPDNEKLDFTNKNTTGKTDTAYDPTPEATTGPNVDSITSTPSDSPLQNSDPISKKQTPKKPPVITHARDSETRKFESGVEAEDNDVNDDERKPSASVYHQAEPVSGYPHLYAYFDRELTYPKEAISDSLEGVVTVIFTINTEGKPENIMVENSLGSAFDHEVNRVIENMPAWKPASYNGKPTKSKVSIPLTFELKNIEQ